MKNRFTIIPSLFLAAFMLFSCNASPNNEKANSTEETATASVETDTTRTAPAPAPASPELPVIAAEAPSERYIDWGERPVEAPDGPPNPWTMPHMLCMGPPYMDAQLTVSSELAPQGEKEYTAIYACDDDPTTAWVEGHPDYGIGEYLELLWAPMNDGTISILNGYQASRTIWENNSRIKTMKVSLDGKDVCFIALADVMGVQTFNIPGLMIKTDKGYEYNSDGLIRFTIAEVYPGLKYKDTAISGLFSCGE